MMEDEAFVAYPELKRLARLRDVGWTFHPAHDDSGELVQVNGVRSWPGGQADALRVRYTTDAAAMRCDPGGQVLWTAEGSLDDVVDGLLDLPDP
ncbi:hypothetical protein SAMN05421504_10854 [Amycolatopsis xylanica]|uniref:Uncharacterized protein n=1 Tax=Amycolatopsis xylanica TaxID=589385 RepID=A0A1H3P7Z2_9PSEU|nr:hypothetical protein [Amycolatopsis xylanica]SDY96935.1 hypothetical protein SAMN05421504_10854 [Amycolatopsis xylanica]